MREASIKCRARCHFAFQDTRFLKRDNTGKPCLKAIGGRQQRDEIAACAAKSRRVLRCIGNQPSPPGGSDCKAPIPRLKHALSHAGCSPTSGKCGLLQSSNAKSQA
ncbi:hypothetical protein APV28_4396 [Comamonas testosteroni]|nr:hypothetical protein APV28_4396 [Comamonas testosteroni]